MNLHAANGFSLCVSPAENSVPPDVTATTPQDRGSRVDLPPAVRGMSRGQSRSSMLDTADGTLAQVPAFTNEAHRAVVLIRVIIIYLLNVWQVIPVILISFSFFFFYNLIFH